MGDGWVNSKEQYILKMLCIVNDPLKMGVTYTFVVYFTMYILTGMYIQYVS